MSWREFITNIDIKVSSLFYDNGHFVFEDSIFGNFIKKGIPEVIVFSAVLIFFVWLWGRKKHKVVWGIDDNVMLLTSGTMFLGPILIVNGIFKSFWGRARPQDILQFGGDKIFSLPLELSNQCLWDCSFMSGHTAVAFWLIAPALLLPKKYKFFAVSTAIVFGCLTAVFRIGQGAHFLTDVLFSAVLMLVLIWFVYRRLFLFDANIRRTKI